MGENTVKPYLQLKYKVIMHRGFVKVGRFLQFSLHFSVEWFLSRESHCFSGWFQLKLMIIHLIF